VELPGGLVGTVAKSQRCPASDAHQQIWDAWTRGGGEVLGLLRALCPSVSSLEKAARMLYPSRADKPLRDDLIEAMTTSTVTRRFGVWPTAQEQQEGDAA
jgi:hypothetical protein